MNLDLIQINRQNTVSMVNITEVEEFLNDPVGAQLTLRYAVNMYQDQQLRSTDRSMDRILRGSVENLVQLKKEVALRNSQQSLSTFAMQAA